MPGQGIPKVETDRTRALAALSAEPVDLLVIGGGITGAGIARDAALRGIRTALVDKMDFGAGTSSRSSRLIHGGLRYLERLEWGLVFEAAHERAVLRSIAPHLVRPLAFLFPVYRGGRIAPWTLRAGMWLYDLLGGRSARRHRWLRRKAVAQLEPRLRSRGIRGAALYYDAQADDARLVLATLRSATAAGAKAISYALVTGFTRAEGTVRGAVIRDMLDPKRREYSVAAAVVVNAAGPWVDAVRRLDDPGAVPLLRPTKGTHVLVRRERLGNTHAVTFLSPVDGRVMFVLPAGDFSYIGTTDTDEPADPDEVRASGADAVYLLRSANAMFPDARLSPRDILATWSGIRPLLAPADSHGASGLSASQVSREHRVLEAPSGLVTIAGGKLTTYRVMGREVVDHVARRLRKMDGRPMASRPHTDRLPLPGGEAADLNVVTANLRVRGIADPHAEHLVRRYGSEGAAIASLVERDRALGEPIAPGRPELWAEVVHAVEREMAVRLSDVMIRRLHLFYEDADQGRRVAPRIAARMAQLLGWDERRRAVEIEDYEREIARGRAFLREVPRATPESVS
ncbi:MAG TPA: glycerol-3-phosphate dehydrogenase/oxidase [Gemmatimonadales bacterium]|nr:glycerol-3-phosphate dehydrogenase/oxidase [Gemmatimonadales bacterium]